MTFAGLLILASGFTLVALAGFPEAARRVRGMFYGWFMAGLGALLMAMASAPLFYGLPVWNPVLRNAFGWSAGQMSWAFAIAQVEGFYAPVVGLLVDKLGPRRMVFIGMVVGGSGFALFSQIQELWHLYVVFLILSLGISVGTWLPMMTVMNHWFTRHKTRAMSLVIEGLTLSGVIVPLLLAWTIGGTDPNISERYGWRTTALFIGILCLVSALPISLLVRNRPADLGLKPDGDSAVPAAASPVDAGVGPSATEDAGYTLQEAIRAADFWLISLGQATTSIVMVTIIVHLGLMLDDRGFSLQTISVVLAVYTAVSAMSILVGGFLGDKLPMGLVAFVFSVLQSLALVVLVFAHGTEMLFLFAVLSGVGVGGRMSVTTAMRGVYFGRKAFAAITGISNVPSTLMWFIAPIFAGLMRDATGTYDVPFLSIATVTLFGAFLFLLLGKAPRRSPPTAVRSQAAD